MDHFLDALEETENRVEDIKEDCDNNQCLVHLDYSTFRVSCRCGKNFKEYGFEND